ncbi:hypothetical protein Nepgr_004614 [Nepenthes gracilis]|uniref:Protein RER1 n=1 Tax=Nepenthes gracilis TaxID=150966 RepID=A0AAD3XFH1_NEPGR|nr:hypothetical protein Nepgr_004614 [Nepenthes gracilis]
MSTPLLPSPGYPQDLSLSRAHSSTQLTYSSSISLYEKENHRIATGFNLTPPFKTTSMASQQSVAELEGKEPVAELELDGEQSSWLLSWRGGTGKPGSIIVGDLSLLRNSRPPLAYVVYLPQPKLQFPRFDLHRSPSTINSKDLQGTELSFLYGRSRRRRWPIDRATNFPRWIGTLVLASIYGLRIFYVQGFYIVAYALGIYILNLLIGFLSPLVDPEHEVSDGPLLPMKGSDEYKPFIRRLPEFKFWYSVTKAFLIAFVLSFFSAFDVPVFWPILLFYWLVLFVLTMKRQIAHMMKHRYIPFSIGKQKYGGKKSSISGGSRAD